MALFHLQIQITVGGGHNANIHLSVRRQRAESSYPQILQNPQQLGLKSQIQLTNFVQEQRATVGRFDESNLARMGIGEVPFSKPKQLPFNQMRGQCCTVDFHERSLRTWAGLVASTGN